MKTPSFLSQLFDLSDISDIQKLREKLLRALLFSASIVALPLYILALIPAVREEVFSLVLIYSILYVGFLGLTFSSHISYHFRVYGWLLILYILGINNLVNSGFNVDAGLFFLTFLIMTVLFFDLRKTVIAMALSLTSITLIGYLIVQENYELSIGLPQTNPILWWVGGTIFLLMGFMTTVSVSVLMNRLTENLGKIKKSSSVIEQKNKEILESELHYRSLVEASPNAIVRLDLRGNIEAVNFAGEALFGLSQTDLLEKNIGNFLETKEQELLKSVLARVSREGTVRDIEISVKPLGGTSLLVEFSAAQVLDAKGNIRGIICVGKDITGKKRIEQKIAQSELMYRSIFDGVNDAILVETTKGEILDVNERACEMFGWSREEFLTKTIRDMVPPEAQVLLPDEQNEDILPIETFETVNVRANGERFPVAITGRIQQLGDEKRLLIVVRDITESKKAEEINARHQKFLSDVLEAITQPFYVINVKDYSIEMANSAARELGQPSASTCYALTHKRDAPCNNTEHPCPLHDVIQNKKTKRVEHIHFDKDGNPRDFEVHGYPIFDEDGNVTQMIEYSLDITERKQILREMEKAKNIAEAATQAKADFLANMSHEIRTPLNAIFGMTSLMLDTPLNEEQQDFIDTIRSGSDTLLRVINDILDFSKIEAGKMELETQPFYVRSCVEDALDLLAEKAADKMLNLACMIEEHTPPVVIGDVTRLRQILVNLLNNALKFTDKGEVVINVKSLLIDNDQHELHFSVRDTGIGIPADKIDKLFKSFSQVDSSTTRKYGGTGLGLAISSQLAKNMGGTMWVESEEGKGATFHFTILVDIDANATSLNPNGVQPELDKKRILIVDDNATNRLILVKQTQSWGMIPTGVESGAEALALLDKGKFFDIAILDMQMPEMDGFTLAKRIGGNLSNSLPLIILTSIKRDKVRSGDVNIAAFLNKPIKQSSLLNILTDIIVAVPVKKEKPVKMQTIDAKMSERHPLRILLAEDNLMNQKVATSILKRMGYRADIAGNGLEAIEALERQTYDVVFMDIQMPEMDGTEATKHIRERWPLERQPYIIAMTAHALEGDREKYIAKGMDDYVSKPVKLDEFIRALENTPKALPKL